MREMISIYFLAIVILFTLSSCVRHPRNATVSPIAPWLRWGTDKLPDRFDWNLCSTIECLRHAGIVMEGLVSLRITDEEIGFEPALAKSLSRPDPKTLRIQLRPDVRWSDGEPLVAEDFVRAWKRLLQNSARTPFATSLFSIANARAFAEKKVAFEKVGIIAPDRFTLKIVFEESAPLFEMALAHPALFPYRESASRNPITLGAFGVESWNATSEIRYARNPNYYGKPPSLAGIHVRAVPEVSTRIDLFLGRETDMVDGIEPSALPHVGQHDTVEWFSRPVVNVLIFNTARRPFSNVNAREAFARAIAREEWAPLLKWNQLPLTNLWPPLSAHPADSRLTFDFDNARAKLKPALGRADGLIRYSLAYPPGEETQALAENLQAQWSKNLEVKVDLIPSAMYFDKPSASGMNSALWPSLYLAKISLPYGNLSTAFNHFWETVGALTHWRSKTFDGLRDRLSHAPNLGDYQKAMGDLESLAVENEILAVPLSVEARPVLRRPQVQNLVQNAVEIWDFRNTTIVP